MDTTSGKQITKLEETVPTTRMRSSSVFSREILSAKQDVQISVITAGTHINIPSIGNSYVACFILLKVCLELPSLPVHI